MQGERYVRMSAGERVYIFVKRVMGKHAADIVCRTATSESWTERQKRPFPPDFRRLDWTIEHIERDLRGRP